GSAHRETAGTAEGLRNIVDVRDVDGRLVRAFIGAVYGRSGVIDIDIMICQRLDLPVSHPGPCYRVPQFLHGHGAARRASLDNGELDIVTCIVMPRRLI